MAAQEGVLAVGSKTETHRCLRRLKAADLLERVDFVDRGKIIDVA